MGDFEDLAELRSEIKERLERNALDKARHEFADRIIDYAVANATIDLPDVLVDQEVEVMHDEFRGALARQGISEEAYAQGHRQEPTRTSTPTSGPTPRSGSWSCSCSRRSPRPRASTIADADVEAEVARGRERYAGDPKLVRYFDSERGRNFIRSTLRRSRTVEHLVDEWLAAHPDHPALPHVEDGPSGALDVGRGRLAARRSTRPTRARSSSTRTAATSHVRRPRPTATSSEPASAG